MYNCKPSLSLSSLIRHDSILDELSNTVLSILSDALCPSLVIIIIIMVISKCYFPGELIALS